MRFYGLVSEETASIVDFYPDERAALNALLNYLSDEPEWEDDLRVEAFEFETSPN